jgi:hypothetical protein
MHSMRRRILRYQPSTRLAPGKRCALNELEQVRARLKARLPSSPAALKPHRGVRFVAAHRRHALRGAAADPRYRG